MSLPTLYQRDSKGKERQWSVHTEGAEVVVQYGLVGGKIAEKRTTSKAKNVGKANETTPEQQALLEAKSKWTKQIEREDYHEDIDKAGLQLRPMLARDYTKVGHQVDWDKGRWLLQPKLDGLRLVYGWRHEEDYDDPNKCELLTRKGEVYKVDHIAKQGDRLHTILYGLGYSVRGLDGELYLHGLPLNQINQRAKKYREGLTEELEYHLFDLVMDDLTFGERYNALREALNVYREEYGESCFRLVPTFVGTDEARMKRMHGKFAQQGYEGIMIRKLDSLYGMAQRPDCLFKYKEFHDAEYKIIDVWEDKNGNAMLTCDNPEGEGEHATFNCTPKRTHDERKEMLGNKTEIIGKWIKVKYQALTEFGVPEFPVGLEIRDCDDNGNPLE